MTQADLTCLIPNHPIFGTQQILRVTTTMIKLVFVRENATALLYSIVLVKRTRLGP